MPANGVSCSPQAPEVWRGPCLLQARSTGENIWDTVAQWEQESQKARGNGGRCEAVTEKEDIFWPQGHNNSLDVKARLNKRKPLLAIISETTCSVKLQTSALDLARSYELDQQVNSFLDFYEVARRDLGEAKGHYIDVDKYKARKELMICSDVQETLRQVPEARTLSQLDQAVRELQKVEVFAQFPRDIQEKVIRRAEYLKLGPRRVIIRKGHKATHFYIIASGTAVVRRVATDPNTGEKKVKKIDFLRPGMTFGEIALISNIPRTGNVMSHDDMQLITVHAEDYVDIFVSTGPGHLISPHLPFLQNLDIMKGWPIQQLLHHPKYCSVRYFKRNVVITHDSKNSPNIYIVRSGHLKVFRFLDWPDDIDPEKSKKFSSMFAVLLSATTDESETSMAFDLIHKPECSRMKIPYMKDKSEHVFWKTIISQRGKRFQWPVVRMTSIHDPLLIRKLKKPDRPKFIPMKILRQEDIFGLDQVPLFKQRRNSRSVILVSLGADCIVLDKKWFCRWAVGETSELLNCTTIQYSDDFIKNRLKDQGNRDVYLEHVLDSYFVKLFRESSGDTNI
ncbi:hypothetical protein C0Q70_21072 [Pomacea canaliculata]|uniref:Cyclic nucleotide-binding domain-containing protein n=1 Tax=Pomacea canaliculata TaxID=400727 RepID=A0A2T7NBH8_POMCA|nr:hypothetical protein C0Q70_21072 [Pomacea canaliculata]